MKKIPNKVVLASFFNLLLKSTALLSLTPFLMLRLSDNELFIWYFLSTIYSVVMLLDIGFLPTISRYTTRLCEKYSIHSIFKIAKKIYLLLSTLTLMSVLSFSYLYLNSKLEGGLSGSSSSLLFLYVMLCSLGLYSNVYASVLHGLNKIYEIQLSQILGTILGLLFSIFSIFVFESAIVTAISFYSSQVIVFFLLKYNFEKKLPVFSIDKICEGDISRDIVKDSIKSGIGIMFSLGVLHVSSLFVTYEMGLVEASAYLFLVQVFRAIISFSQPIFYTRIPTINNIYNKSRNFYDVVYYSRKYLVSSLLFYVILVFSAYFFCEVYFNYTNKLDLKADYYVWVVFAIAFFFERLCSMMLQVYTATGKMIWHKINGLTGVVIILVISIFYLNDSINTVSYPVSVLISYSFVFLPIIVILSFKEMKVVNKI